MDNREKDVAEWDRVLDALHEKNMERIAERDLQVTIRLKNIAIWTMNRNVGQGD
jgi:hypothetical protein